MGLFGALWGVAGALTLLGFAVWRLAGVAWEGLAYPLGPLHWAVLVANVAFMAYFEGFRGFQRGYSPRLVERARKLSNEPTPLRILLAPLYCMGFFGAERRRLIATYVLTLGIVTLVLLFHSIPQPWRGILDFGVVVGLSWGIVSIAAFAVRTAWRPEPAADCAQR